MTDAPERILLLQLYHLGDVILTTPTIRAARLAFPNARIDFVTNALGAQALEANPHLNHILVKPPFWYFSRTRYHVVVDLHSVPRTARTVAITRAGIRIGLRGRGPRNLAYTKLLPRENNAVYMALQKLRMLAPLGVLPEAADLSLEMAIDESQHEWARQTFERLRLGSHVVAVSP